MVSDSTRRYWRPRTAFKNWTVPSLLIEPEQQQQGPAQRTRKTMRSQRPAPEIAPEMASAHAMPSRRRLGMTRGAPPWQRTLSKKRIIGLINLCVFCILSWQMVSIFRMGGDVDLPSRMLDMMKLDELPYPLNIVVQVHRKNITVSPFETRVQFPGYVKVQEGTFRNKYPSTKLEGTGTFDSIFVITSEKCEQQWEEFQTKANAVPLQYTKWLQTDAGHISLKDPPLPMVPGSTVDVTTGKKLVKSNLKRQLAYLDAHRRLWQFIVDTGKQRVLVIDDTLFPNDRLRRSLPAMLTNIDQESVARQMSWHFIFLRRQVLSNEHREPAWTMNSVFNHAVVHANVSFGAGAYVLSQDGARFLAKHVTQYRAPLDIEIGQLQSEFPNDFVALSACNNDAPVPLCPEIMDDIATRRTAHTSSCAWRRFQEKRMASSFPHYFVT